MDLTIRRAGAFRKHEYALAGFQQAYHVLEAGGIRVFLVNGDSLAEGQGPFENALEQRLACEKIDAVLIRNAQHGRIQKALVIADDEHGAVFDEFFPG